MIRFEYVQPTTLQDAISVLSSWGDEAKLLAGGTDLVVRMRQRVIRPKYVISIGEIAGLDGVSLDQAGHLTIGALTTIRTIEKSPEVTKHFPILSESAKQLGSIGVRNLATVGGNICNAAPSADMVPGLLVLSATVKIAGPEGEKMLPLLDFFTGPGCTVLKRGEVLTEIHALAPPARTGSVYLKHGIRGASDLAIVGVAASITLEPGDGVCRHATIALGAVAPTPVRASQAESVLVGKRIDEDVIEEAVRAAVACCRPISDVRASDWYRRDMVEVFTRRALRQALELART